MVRRPWGTDSFIVFGRGMSMAHALPRLVGGGESMKGTLLEEANEKTFALIFEKGDEVIGELTAFAQAQGVSAAHFTAIGAFRHATLAYFNPATKDYQKIPVKEQVEVLSLV